MSELFFLFPIYLNALPLFIENEQDQYVLELSCLVMQKIAFPLFLSVQLSPNCDTASKWCKRSF